LTATDDMKIFSQVRGKMKDHFGQMRYDQYEIDIRSGRNSVG
jgi:hypothetical protein